MRKIYILAAAAIGIVACKVIVKKISKENADEVTKTVKDKVDEVVRETVKEVDVVKLIKRKAKQIVRNMDPDDISMDIANDIKNEIFRDVKRTMRNKVADALFE